MMEYTQSGLRKVGYLMKKFGRLLGTCLLSLIIAAGGVSPVVYADETETDSVKNASQASILPYEFVEKSPSDEIYTFELSESVTRQHVRYENRFGITLAADLYYSSDLDKTSVHPALVVGPPYGGVKEQGPGVYANQMAQRGFVVLAFDPSFNGESSGEPRHVSSPDFFVEDFSAGVDVLGALDFVDREKIGAIGICGSGSFALTAAQVDQRIKAVATASMYDISSYIRDGLFNSLTDEGRLEMLTQLSEQRWSDFENGGASIEEPLPGVPKPLAEVPEGLNPVAAEFFSYYLTERGYHPNSYMGFTPTSAMSFMNFSVLDYVEDISPRPILMVIGENGHSNYFSEGVFEKASEPKSLYVVDGANHVDLYDNVDLIPFDLLESFFEKNLK